MNILNNTLWHHSLGNDRWAAEALKMKKDGFFIEAGANDGYSDSCTYMLEKKLNWSGILIEPSLKFDELCTSDRKAAIDDAVLWSNTGFIDFVEVPSAYSGYSGVLSVASKEKLDRVDPNLWHQKQIRTYKCDTLQNVLNKYNAPKNIDYLALDVEGSELEVFEGLDFNYYNIKLISVESNDDTCVGFLSSKGYKRVTNTYSKVTYEYYFVKSQDQ